MNHIDKFNEMYDKYLIKQKEPKYMIAWGDTNKKLMAHLSPSYPQVADMWLEMLESEIESKEYVNYLSRKEAENILANMSPSAMWSVDQVKEATKMLGVPYEKDGHWNCYALAATMNMIMSDHRNSINKRFSGNDLVVFVYEQAVERLEDSDAGFRVRKYWEKYI